jgi:protein-tyrosine phosphatase
MVSRYGYIPVIAHPERYVAVQNSPGLAVRWFEKGYVIQLNKGSLLGRLGQTACDTAQYLLSAQIAHVVASDAHDMRGRAPGFHSLLPLLRDFCAPKYVDRLVEENPYKIVTDQDL